MPRDVPADEVQRLHYHAFSAGSGQIGPPFNRCVTTQIVIQVHDLERTMEK
jgi:hypothetical protein